MAKQPPAADRVLLEAASFAARAHEGQRRKDGRTPYVSHVFRVCLVMRHVFGIEDLQALTAAILHDTIEDTTTDFDDLQEAFGDQVAHWVRMLSKDKRLPEAEREKAYVQELAAAPWQVKVCKLADIYDNLTDACTIQTGPSHRVLENAQRYLAGLKPNLPEPARRPFEIVSALLAQCESAV